MVSLQVFQMRPALCPRLHFLVLSIVYIFISLYAYSCKLRFRAEKSYITTDFVGKDLYNVNLSELHEQL